MVREVLRSGTEWGAGLNSKWIETGGRVLSVLSWAGMWGQPGQGNTWEAFLLCQTQRAGAHLRWEVRTLGVI